MIAAHVCGPTIPDADVQRLRQTVDVQALVAEIKNWQAVKPMFEREPSWERKVIEHLRLPCNSHGKPFENPMMALTRYLTGLYMLRAALRGKLHRCNPPAPIRDYNRSMEQAGMPSRKQAWDPVAWNLRTANSMAESFPKVTPAATG